MRAWQPNSAVEVPHGGLPPGRGRPAGPGDTVGPHGLTARWLAGPDTEAARSLEGIGLEAGHARPPRRLLQLRSPPSQPVAGCPGEGAAAAYRVPLGAVPRLARPGAGIRRCHSERAPVPTWPLRELIVPS